MDDWIAYLEAEPKSEPFLSIAAAWKADKARLAEAERLLRDARGGIPGNHTFTLRRIDAFLAADSGDGRNE